MKVRLSPDGDLFVWSDHENQWNCWSPNGEYFESRFGDEVPDFHTDGWGEVVEVKKL